MRNDGLGGRTSRAAIFMSGSEGQFPTTNEQRNLKSVTEVWGGRPWGRRHRNILCPASMQPLLQLRVENVGRRAVQDSPR